MIAVYAVTPMSSTCSPISPSAMVRCPVEEIGRNSVTPSTMPRTIACQMIHAQPPIPARSYASATWRSVVEAGLAVGREQAHRQRGHAGLGVRGAAPRRPASTGPSSAVAVDEVQRHGGRGVALPLGQVQVLHLAGGVAEAHPDGELVVEVLLPAAHAADVERGVPADQLGARRDVVADHDRHRRHHVEAVQRLADLGPAGRDRGQQLGRRTRASRRPPASRRRSRRPAPGSSGRPRPGRSGYRSRTGWKPSLSALPGPSGSGSV